MAHGKKLEDIDDVPPYWPDELIVREGMLDYAFETEWFDAQLGKMLQTLEKAGELENTLVIAFTFWLKATEVSWIWYFPAGFATTFGLALLFSFLDPVENQ